MRNSHLKTIATMVAMASTFFVLASEPASPSFNTASAPDEMVAIVCPISLVVAEINDTICETFVNIPFPTSNDPNCPIVSGDNNNSGIYSDGIYSFVYNVVDDCGMMTTCNQMVIVIDNTAPLIIAPNNALVECGPSMIPPALTIADFIAQGGVVEDACGLDSTSFDVDPDVLVSSTPCMKIFDRTYRISDEANNTEEATQRIFINDVTPPTIDSCTSMVSGTVSANLCEGFVSIPLIVANDNCGVMSIVNDQNGTNDASGIYPFGNTTVTWTVTDSCNNTATCQTIVSITDQTPPSASLPADTLFAQCDASEIAPYADLAAFLAAGGTASDQCGSVTFMYDGEISVSGTCPQFVTRSYTLSDDAVPPNDSTLLQIIRVEENVAPSFDPPVDVTLDCSLDINDVNNVGTISNFIDNCSSAPESVTSSDSLVSSTCPGNQTINRTYTVTDSCGNSSTGVQVITLVDTIAPVAVCADISVYLNAIGEVNIQAEMLNGGSSDNCTPDSLLVFRIINGSFDGCNGVNLTSMRMLEVGDGCGLFDTCTSMVTVLDTIPPTLTCPPDSMITCTEDLPPAFMTFTDFENAGGSWDDNCLVNGQDTFYLLNENNPTTFTCPYNITRTYLVTDNSGNSATCTQTFTVNDDTPPVMDQLADITISGASSSCDTLVTVPLPTFTENCDSLSVMITNSENGNAAATGRYPLGTTMVSYYTEDACGNRDTMSFNVIVDGDPMFTCPGDIDLLCSLSDAPAYATYAEFESAGGSFVATCAIDTNSFTLLSQDTIPNTTCDTTYERTYQITSVSGLVQFSCTQNVRVRDTVPPVSTNNTPLVVSSVEDGLCMANIASISISATDNCGTATITNNQNGTDNAGGMYPYGETTVIWTIEDACGNTAIDTTIVLIGDNEPPNLFVPNPPAAQCSPGGVDTLMSYAELLAAGGSASDNCEIDTASFTITRDTVTNFFGLLLPVRIYEIRDIAGNRTFATVLLSAMDTQNPSIETLPDTILYTPLDTCIVQLVLPIPQTSDNCGVDSIYNSLGLALDSLATFEIDTNAVTWFVTDSMGNISSSSYNVVVRDTIAPVVVHPDPGFALCNANEVALFTSIGDVNNLNGSVTDACGVDSIRFVMEMPGSTPNSVDRIYIVTDDNGNTSNVVHAITIMDTIPPVIANCPDTLFTFAGQDSCAAFVRLDTTGMNITDNCQLDTVFNTFSMGGADASGVYNVGITSVLFIAEDNDGNRDTCEVIVNVQDTVPPSVSCPDTIRVQCAVSEAPAFDLNGFINAGGSLSDFCALDSTSFTSSLVETSGQLADTLCQRSYERTYSIQDTNGNTGSCTQVILVQDTIAPVFAADTGFVLYSPSGACSADLTLPRPVVDDNCGIDTLFNNRGIAVDSMATFPVDTTVLTWYAEDFCGNMDSLTYSIIVLDTVAPVVIAPDTSFAQCNDTLEVALINNVNDLRNLNGDATDICGIDSIRFDTSTIVSMSPVTAHRQYTVVDVNGNSTSFIHVVITMDTIPPSFVVPGDITISCIQDENDLNITGNISMVDDNCVVQDTNVSNTILSSNPCNFQILRFFTVSDAMGNMTVDSQLITIIDTIDPVFTTTIIRPADIGCTSNPSDFPSSQTLSVMDSCDPNPSFTVDTIFTVDLCNGYEVKYIYTGSDVCGNEVVDSTSFMVLPDTLPPVLDAPLDTIRLNTDTCGATFTLPVPSVSDDCTTPTVTNNYSGDFFPIDTSFVDWYLVDSCGNRDTFQQVVVVTDNIAPSVTAPDTSFAQCNDTLEVPFFADLGDFYNLNGTAADTCGLDSIRFDTSTVVSMMPVTAHRQYTIFDVNGNGTSVVHVVITMDTIPPSFVVPADTVISCLENEQDLSITGNISMVTDNCQVQDTTLTDSIIMNNPCNFVIRRYFEVSDAMGNTTVDSQMITLIDTVAPVFADTIITPPDIWCTSNVNDFPPSQVLSVVDSCDASPSFTVDTLFTVDLCNGYEVKYIYTGADTCGNEVVDSTSFMVLPDSLPPSISSSTALPPVRITCDYPIDTSELSEFGKLVFDLNERDSINVEGSFWGFDGYVLDNCPDHVVIEESLNDMTNRCGQGVIERIFTLRDTVSNATTVTTQSILVYDDSPIVREDITFPETYTHSDCNNPIVDPSISGRPIIQNENKCSDVAVNMTDMLFDQVFSGCPTVRRTWTVIDWCQYSTSNPNGPGKWVEVQFIKVMDTIPPVFVPADDVTICSALDECDVLVSLSAEASDSCTDPEDLNYSYSVDTDGDGFYDVYGLGSSFSDRFGFGSYQIKWMVDDGCGNTAEQVVNFDAADCKPPQAVCLNGVSIALDQYGQGLLWASDLDQYSDDNCTPSNELIFSFEADSIVTGRIFTCDSLGLRTVAMWVTDAAGNQSVCYTTVDVQDNTGVCNGPRIANIGGRVLSRGDLPLEGTGILLEGPEMEASVMTDENGHFAFENLETQYDYAVEPNNDTRHGLGVSTLDLVLIQRHILNMAVLEDPLDLIAADVDNNQRITGSDVVQLRKIILGIDSEFSNNTSWRFVDMQHDFEEPEFPWPFPENWVMNNVRSDYMETDFIGVKVGDIDGSVNDILGKEALENRSIDLRIPLSVQDIRFKEGDEIHIPIKGRDWLEIVATQWNVAFDNKVLDYISVESDYLDALEASIATNDEGVRLAWFDINPSSIGDENTILTLTFKAKQSGLLSDVFEINDKGIEMVAYNRSNEKVVLDFAFLEVVHTAFELYQNSPNPFKSTTEISFNLAQQSEVDLSFFDNQGRLIHRHSAPYDAGYHTYVIQASDIDPSVGVIIYALTVNGLSETKKMIRLE